MSGMRDELERAAADRVARSGISELSFRTLADQVGVKSSSVHYYFPEKSDLTAALIKSYSAEFSKQLALISANEYSLRQKLVAFVEIFERATADNKLCLCGMLAAEVASLNDRNRGLLAEFFKLGEHWLGDLFKLNAEQLNIKLKPDTLAMSVMSGLEGAILIDRVRREQRHLRSQKLLIVGLIK